MNNELCKRPRKLVARCLAVLVLLGVYFLASVGMTGLVLTTATPAAAQRGNRGGRGQVQNKLQGQGKSQVQRRRKKGLSLGGVLAPLLATPGEPYRRRRRRRD